MDRLGDAGLGRRPRCVKEAYPAMVVESAVVSMGSCTVVIRGAWLAAS